MSLGEMEEINLEIQYALGVLNNAVANINELDINELQVSIEITDNPMIQCAQRCE